MGSIASTMKETMDKNLKEQQDFMLTTQKMQLERQIQMQLQMRNRQLAQQLAMVRERTYWYGTFYVLAALGLTRGYLKNKQPWALAPLLPLTFIVGYQIDMAFGNKMDRIISEADSILEHEKPLLAVPGGPPTIKSIDEARLRGK